MHPTGIEPALKASEASVLSIRLRVRRTKKLLNYYKFITAFSILTYLIPYVNVKVFHAPFLSFSVFINHFSLQLQTFFSLLILTVVYFDTFLTFLNDL